MPSNLIESELFGHERGAFTDAKSRKIGLFEEANGGTIFLDEIGEMDMNLQVKLLRVLEDRKIRRLGGNRNIDIDVRVVAATNLEIKEAIEQTGFREDLYYRLASYRVAIPPLRERREDLPLIVDHFVERFAEEMGLKPPRVSQEFMDEIGKHQFPGNVRQLRNIIEHALIESSGEDLQPSHLLFHRDVLGLATGGDPRIGPPAQEELPANLKEAQKVLIDRAVRECNGNLSEAARRLGISRAKLYRALN